MVDDIIAALSLSRGVRVIAQSATASYRKNVSDLRTIGRELGARYILEGNLRRMGADLRVTTQLVEAETGAILSSPGGPRHRGGGAVGCDAPGH
jgi:TolB-like protein